MPDRQKRVDQTIDLLDAWAGIGVFARIAFVLAIIACFVWSLKTIFEMVLWLRVLLG
jgi:hypothetical protein